MTDITVMAPVRERPTPSMMVTSAPREIRSSGSWTDSRPLWIAGEIMLTSTFDPIAGKFEDLADQWEVGTSFASDLVDIVLDSSYQQIIGLGPGALPHVLRRLRDKPAYWFWALAALTGQDVAEGTQTFDDARAAWLAWGVRQGQLDAFD